MKNLLRRLKLDELSLVDRGANPGARVTLWKRDGAPQDPVAKVDREPLVALCQKFLDDDEAEINFSDALREELERQERFAIHDKLFPLFDALRESVMTAAAELSGEAREQKIRDNVEAFLASARAELNTPASKAGTQDAGSPGDSHTSKAGGTDMSELEKKVGELEAQVADLTEKAESLTKERDALIEATGAKVDKTEDGEINVTVEKADPVETIEIGGQKVAKSELSEGVLKALEAQETQLSDMRKRQEREDLRKRAETELPNLSGDADHKAELIKAIDGIEDEGTRKGVLETLKAADASVSKMFAEVGKTVADDENSASYRLEKLAQDTAKEEGITYERAFAKVIDTPDGAELRKQADAERRAQ